MAVIAPRFAKCFTIELSPVVYERGAQRLATVPNVECLLGDSAAVLPTVLDRLDGPALFWLDAHFSGGDTAAGRDPILSELETIYCRRDLGSHVVLIDDARAHDLVSLRRALPPHVTMTVRNDIVRIVPA